MPRKEITELEIINELGIASFSEIKDKLDKSKSSIIAYLNTLQKYGLITIVELQPQIRLYCQNEVYKNIIRG
jgi:DNA-binding IclR family transcriptional regulator